MGSEMCIRDSIKGLAYCVGSIDLKPLKMATENDFNKCMKLNFYSAVDLIKGFQDNLKQNSGSIVLFSTVAAQRGFTNHSIIASTKAAIGPDPDPLILISFSETLIFPLNISVPVSDADKS